MPTFNSIEELNAHLQTAINNALENEVAKGIKEVIQQEVRILVYGAGQPIWYERRNLSNGSLGDIGSMHSMVYNNTLFVTDNAKPKKQEQLNPLVENIEEGYWGKDKWWNIPRPFMSSAEDIILENKAHIIWLSEGLDRQGIKVK